MRVDPAKRNGSILLLVLLAIVIMSLATASYLTLMRNEHRAARNAGQQLQSRLLEESGSDYLCLFLDQTDILITQQGGILTNPGTFQGQLVADDLSEASRGRFTVISPDVVDGYYSGFRYGLEDESSKLNLNLLVSGDIDEEMARNRLMFIPAMTEDVADAILDWIDDDNQPRAYGAEDSYYQGLSPPRMPQNAPLRSVSELLQVRGVTAELLYGLDANRNLVVDEGEVARGVLAQIDNSLGQMNRGWSAYFAVYAAERAVTPTGTPKVNVNNRDLRELQTELQKVVDAEAANFILAYRQFGPTAGDAQGSGGGAASLTINLDTPATTEISSLLDLVGARVSVQQNQGGQPPGQQQPGNEQEGEGQQGEGEGAPSGGPPQPGGAGGQIVESPWQDRAALYSGVFLDLLDKLTTTDEPARGGRVNINLASRPVLLTVPGLTEMQADQIITMREPAVDRQTGPQRHAIWLLANGVVTLEEMKALDPFVTAAGDVYSGQIVGFFDGQPAVARAQVAFDRTDTTTLVVGREDMTKLGPGFLPEDLGAQVIAE
jgi:DNA uptake protein ComE-like DNA-binding protein